ncbi:LOW QUALITY PROTEIN: transposase, partial [Mycobacterium tuberculosis SUMu002]
LPRRRRPGAQGARGRPRRRGAHLDRHRRQRRGATERSWASRSPPPRRGRLAGVLPRPGRPRACPGSRWSPATPTPAWWPRSAPPCPQRPGSAAEPTTQPITVDTMH